MTWLELALGLYVAGVVITAGVSAIVFETTRNYEEDAETARAGARWLLGSPIWPILAVLSIVRTFGRALTYAKEYSK